KHPEAKVIAIGHHDFFALGPPSSEWWVLTKREPVNARSFKRFMESKAMEHFRRKGAKIIVGGPAAWQWLYKPDLIERWGVSTVIDGEADKAIVSIVKRALDGEELPKFVQVGIDETPSLEEIPLIRKPSVNGLVEVSRGCPRRCRFCSVTLRPLRHYTLEMISREIEVNTSSGVKSVILHSDDVLLYGSESIYPNEKALIKLHELVRSKGVSSVGWSHFSLSAVKYAEDEGKLISRISSMLGDYYKGVEVGIETGSSRLAERMMPAKTLPYDVREWRKVVIDSFAIMHEAKIIPAATLITGLPDERPEDTIASIELVEDLREFRSLIVPMYFVPMGLLKGENWYDREPTEEQLELMRVCLRHDLRWVEEIARWYVKDLNPLARYLLSLFLSSLRVATRRFLEPSRIEVPAS
ncbi:MAG: B12-binding domain-containing radical SAM protein, partial [Candidatus Korarchaeum sp.]|nr:B12-binding domain-containing radical SAM protein [Candidatus Korarchaeum sp.]MDW8035871.1 radical SAM protein [Candidatus Korarchaeum sp.]